MVTLAGYQKIEAPSVFSKKTPLPRAHCFPLLLVDPLITFISVIFVVATAFIEIYRVARRCL